MLALYGVPVTEEDCRTLVDLLLRVGRADDLSAAAAIEHGLEVQARLIALTPSERTAILGVLDDPPEGLTELRGVLIRDHEQHNPDEAAGTGA